MSDLTNDQLRRVVLRGLRRMSERFAEDPTPTDGSIRAAIAKMRAKPAKAAIPRRKAATTRRKRSA